MHKSEQNSLCPQTCAATLSSLHQQMCRCAVMFSSLNEDLVQLQQKLILKLGVANVIKDFILTNLRKQLASAETLVGKIMMSLEYQ